MGMSVLASKHADYLELEATLDNLSFLTVLSTAPLITVTRMSFFLTQYPRILVIESWNSWGWQGPSSPTPLQ